jgi:hypothetical protein
MAAANPARDIRPAEAVGKSGMDTSSGTAQDISKGESKLEVVKTDENLVEAFKAVNLTPSLVVNGSGTVDAERTAIFGDGSPDDPFQRADSGSDLGTKPPSLDGKSITSGTTFALDEKESLRPDDSASVKAAEDDDAFSGRGSIVAGSRIGSEAAGKPMNTLRVISIPSI